MGVYEEVKANRRMVHIGIWLGYALALAVLVVRIINTDSGRIGELLGSLALATTVSVAPSLAWLSLDRRPGLLPVAALTSLVSGLLNFLFLPISFLVSLSWIWAWSRRPMRKRLSRGLWWGGVALAFGPVIAVLVMFSHLDPVCTETLADGTVIEVDPTERGYQSGWRFGSVDSTGTGSFQSGFEGVVSSYCGSDSVTWWEAGLAASISLGVVGAATRWPVNEPISGRSEQLSS